MSVESPVDSTATRLWIDASSQERVKALSDLIRREWPIVEAGHRRRALREAYGKRRQWRKADIQRLLNLGVNVPAQRRMARILKSKRPGRGVVREYIPCWIRICHWARQFQEFAAATTPLKSRLEFFKRTPWWPNFIEAMYRAELLVPRQDRGHRRAREVGHEKSSEIAEIAVAAVAGISPDAVHALCQKVRRERKRGAPKDPVLPIAEFKRVLETGDNFRVSETR